MKRTFTFLMSLVLMLGSAWAQMEVGTYYRIKVANGDTYLTISGYNGEGSGNSHGAVPFLAKELNNEDQFWTVEAADAEGEYYLKSKSGYYIVHGGWNIDAYDAPDTKGKIAFVANGDDTYKIKNLNTNQWYKTSVAEGVANSPLYPYCDGAEGAAASFSFEAVDFDAEQAVKVTYVYKIGDKTYATSEAIIQQVNSEPNAPAVAFVTIDSYTGTIGTEDCEIVVNCSANLPFAVTEDLKNPVWQVVEMHRNRTFRVWKYDAVKNVVFAEDHTGDKQAAVADDMLWCFTGNLIDGFTIYNKAVGTEKTLNATPDSVSMGVAENGNNVWKLAKSTFTEASSACFTNNGTTFMNRIADNKIGYWNNADNGSTCYFFAPAAVVTEVVNTITSIPVGVVGSYIIAKETQEALADALLSLEEDPSVANSQELAEVLTEILNGDKVELKAGDYYIKATGTGNDAAWFVTYDAANNFNAVAQNEEIGDSCVWSFEAADEAYMIKNNKGVYVDTLVKAPAATLLAAEPVAAAKYTFEDKGYAKFVIKDGNGQVMRTENDGTINYWSGEQNETWYLIPVDEEELPSFVEKFYESGASSTETVIYDLQGRRVEKMTKGLYIVNGKKVLVK